MYESVVCLACTQLVDWPALPDCLAPTHSQGKNRGVRRFSQEFPCSTEDSPPSGHHQSISSSVCTNSVGHLASAGI